MKSPPGSHFVLTISFMISLLGSSFLPMTGGSPAHEGAPVASYTPFEGRIMIYSEDDFTSENGVVSGSGMKEDPYIIEGWSFNSSEYTPVIISKTRSYVIVRNISASGSSPGVNRPSVQISTADNIIIRNSSFIRGCGGIWMSGPSKNITVEGNRIENNSGWGLYVGYVFENLNIRNNELIRNQNDGLYATNPYGKDIKVINNTFVANYAFGIEIIDGSIINITGNRFIRNGNGGIHTATTAPGVVIASNVIEDHDLYGLELQGVEGIKVLDNRIDRNGHIGILLGSDSVRSEVRGNDLSGNGEGIVLGWSSNITLEENNIAGSEYGIVCEGSWNRILSNSVSDCEGSGILVLHSGDENVLASNRISNSSYGLVIWNSNCVEVRSNTISGIGASAIQLIQCRKVLICDNNLSYDLVSVSMEDSGDTILASNRFLSNGSKIDITSGWRVTIYDNWFRDSSGIIGSGSISWSLPGKVSGKNIIGGDFLFGNYWADYPGEDIDGDGIGDTLLPFGPGDLGPLVIDHPPPDTVAPVVILGDEWIQPATGIEAQFRFKVLDNRSLFGVNVSIAWIIKDRLDNELMNKGFEQVTIDGTGRFETADLVPVEAETINFSFRSTDRAGNLREQNIEVRVRDVIPPGISHIDFKDNGWTEEDFIISLVARDNIAIERVYATYYFDNETYTLLESNGSSAEGNDIFDILIDMEDRSELHFVLRALDINGLVTEAEWMWVPIMDDVAPWGKDVSKGQPSTGSLYNLSFMISDNMAVSEASLNVKFDGEYGKTFECSGLQNGIWDVAVEVREDAQNLEFDLKVKDGSDNQFVLKGDHPVRDATPPTITLIGGGKPMTGDEFAIILECEDNRDLQNGSVEWWIDDGDHVIDQGIPDVTTVPTIAQEAQVLHIKAHVIDGSGNRGEFLTDIEIGDGTPPFIALDYEDPLTSHKWNLTARSADYGGVEKVWIEYSIDGGPYVTGGESISIDVPEDAMTITIIARSRDISGLMTNLTSTITVGDGTPPMVLTHSVKGIGGGKVRFTLEAYDNRGDVQAYLILDDGDPMEMEKEGGSYRLTLGGNDLEGAGSYHFNVVDGAGLSTSTVEGKLDLGGGSPWAIILFASVSIAVMVLIAAIFIIRMIWGKSEE